jgi:RNA-binding protein YhbY
MYSTYRRRRGAQVPLSSKERRELAARGHHLKASVTLPTEVLADHVRQVRNAFAGGDLVKIRIRGEDRAACERAVADVADRVPCQIVQRVGRVVLLYQPKEDSKRP